MEQTLSPQEATEALVARYACSRDPRLRATIIERHENLVRSLAHKFVRRGVSVEDLVQSAWIALIGALDRYDPSHNARFSTYAVHCMVGEIKRYYRDRTWSVKVPRHLQEIAANLNRVQDELCRKLQREPTVLEMSEALRVSEEELLQAMELGYAYMPQGLDDRHEMGDGNDSMSLAEEVGGFDDRMEAVVEHAPLNAAIDTLDERKQKVVRLRFFAGWTQQEVAEELGISQMHVSRLERTALKELRNVLDPATVGAALAAC